jgi:hypothetical protein
MTTITHRVGNTRNLTPSEVDANFDRLNTEVAEIVLDQSPVNNLVSVDTTKALAASQGPAITSSIAAVQTSATNANTVANSAAAIAGTANTNATAAVAAAAAATSAASAATAAVAAKANIASPSFTGTPVSITPSVGDNTTKIATTAYVKAEIAASAPTTAVATAFTTAIPFDGIRYMAQQVVTGAQTFTINTSGSVIGGECQISLQADGTHTPNFSAFVLAGEQDYDNTAGQVNDILFFRTPGGYRYGVILGAAADVTAPSFVSAAVANATPTVVNVTFSENFSGSLSAAAAFTVSGHTVSSVAAGATSNIVNLTCSAPFVNGEAARTVAYTQPGSNKLQDAAGNLTASFSGGAITNNVADTTAPTVTAVSVSNSTPTRVDITFSEAILSTLPVYTSFTVSGHSVSAITYVDTTHVYLTVDAFVAGETRTLAYTQPGANNLKDLAGNNLANFSGTSITDNVSAGGSLSRAIVTSPSSTDLTTLGATDWIKTGFGGVDDSKNGGTAISVNLVNYAKQGWSHTGTTFTWSDGDVGGPTGVNGPASDAIGMDVSAAGTGKYQFIFPAGTSTKTAYVFVRPDGASYVTMRATLSDASATELVETTSVTGSEFSRRYAYTYNSAASSQTLTVSIETGSGLSDVSYVMVEGAAYA